MENGKNPTKKTIQSVAWCYWKIHVGRSYFHCLHDMETSIYVETNPQNCFEMLFGNRKPKPKPQNQPQHFRTRVNGKKLQQRQQCAGNRSVFGISDQF